jgi:GH18 family chitinase
VPGLPRDMLAFTAATIPLIEPLLDFFNIMTYDLMNRRDNVTKHHTGLALSLQAMKAYIENGVPARKANLGFALYVKWFKTSSDPAAVAQCEKDPIGCPTALMEDPTSGADLGKAGAFAYDDNVPEELKESWERAQKRGKYDEVNGGWHYWDEGGLGEEGIWWSWDTEEAIRRKIPFVLELGYGGVFAWGLGEDGPDWRHVDMMNKGVKWLGKVGKGEKQVLDEPHIELR